MPVLDQVRADADELRRAMLGDPSDAEDDRAGSPDRRPSAFRTSARTQPARPREGRGSGRVRRQAYGAPSGSTVS